MVVRYPHMHITHPVVSLAYCFPKLAQSAPVVLKAFV
jgi:hypothetical protein